MMRKWSEEDLRTVAQDREEVDSAVQQIGAMLAGRAPQVRGAILADVFSMWLAGWHARVREQAMSSLLNLIRDRVPVQEERAEQSNSNT